MGGGGAHQHQIPGLHPVVPAFHHMGNISGNQINDLKIVMAMKGSMDTYLTGSGSMAKSDLLVIKIGVLFHCFRSFPQLSHIVANLPCKFNKKQEVTSMKKLNLAIIGQGRSGKNIHGSYYLSEGNCYYNVKYVVDADATRREISLERYPGCTVFADYKQLFTCKDIDLVVNATYSQFHYSITKDLLEHGYNVLVEKPFGRSRFECEQLIRLAEEKGVVLAVFQQTFYSPMHLFAAHLMKSGKLGQIKEIRVHYSNFARRWDWQTLQKNVAGSAYNTGPHPIGVALGLMDFDPNIRVAYSKLDRVLTSGDADDFVKIILDAPGKPFADIEIHSNDAYSPWNIQLLGSLGTMRCTTGRYEMTYLVPEENPQRPVQEGFLEDADHNPAFCKELLIKHTEQGNFDGDAFDVGTASLYEELYYAITEGKPMTVTPEMAARIIGVIETVHGQNPLPVNY